MSFFPVFFPIFSPVYVFQIVLQITVSVTVVFPLPFPFPAPALSCPAMPNVTPFSVTLGGPFDTILSTPKFTVTELGIGPNGGTLIKVQSLGYAAAVQTVTVITSKFVSLAPFGHVTFEVVSSPTFALKIESAGQAGCVQATRSGLTLVGQSAHN